MDIFHVLAIDYDDIVYGWGYNKYGQCGCITESYHELESPKPIEFFKDVPVRNIECGVNHSYVATLSNQHYLFGNNDYNQCMMGDHIKTVSNPHCINDILNMNGNQMTIKLVSLGCDNTKIIVCSKSIDIICTICQLVCLN